MSEVIHNGTYTIRPAGRHILTIGSNLIKDKYAAVVELVKNAYDADAEDVTVAFTRVHGREQEEDSIIIEVRDTGSGMSFDTVINQWMVPSTDDKVRNPQSPDGRIRQGSKGVGRYAASALGKELLLETITASGELTTLYLVWDEFEKAEFLEQVRILVETVSTVRPKGTSLRMSGAEIWTDKEIANLRFELRKLIIPSLEDADSDAHEDSSPAAAVDNTDISASKPFAIRLAFDESWPGKDSGKTEYIQPFPILGFYDYRIWGHVNEQGEAALFYHNNRGGEEPVALNFHVHLHSTERHDVSYCGPVEVDFRVYDREPQAIQNMIDRGLKDPETGEPIGRSMAKSLLNRYHGIGVYRNGFRIRPLGDSGFDWLSLDKRRVQQPSLRIGSDQVIGFIKIASESISHLEEKSARDGLRETAPYFGLIQINQQILTQLESRRFAYRYQAGLGRVQENFTTRVDSLFRLEDLRTEVERTLDTGGVPEKVREQVIALIDTKQENNVKKADALKRIVAIYQGQATIGKIVHIVLHEGRKPLSYFNNAAHFITGASKLLTKKFSQENLDKIVKRVQGFEVQAKILSGLFGKLDPLAARRGERKVAFNLKQVINEVLNVYESEMAHKNIVPTVVCDEGISFYGWVIDFHAAFTNLLENSIYWLQTVDHPGAISFMVSQTETMLQIEYRDNGPGIAEEFIESQVIFEPEFTTKTDSGSGLGLAIAGEAVSRNNGRLSAEYPDQKEGVLFVMQFSLSN